MMPQPGNVMTQVITMSLTTLKLMADRRFTAPTPIMAVVFVCVVLTGIPKMENPRRQAAPAISAEKPGISPAYHIHAHGFDDFLSSDGRSQGHGCGSQQKHPQRELYSLGIAGPVDHTDT